MTLAEQFGDNLRLVRERRGYTQRRLAELSGKFRTDISDIERGRKLPRLDTIVLLAEAMNVEPSILVAGLELIAADE
jgi:transcriptional regulator with XRE-family HTH domain